MAKERMHHEPVNRIGHVGLNVIPVKDTGIKQRNARIGSRKMIIAEIILPTAKAAEAADEAVDEVHRDRTMAAEPLRSRILLNPVMRKVVTAQLRNMVMTARLTVKLLARKQASFRKKHTGHQATEAGFLIAAPRACPPEIGPYSSTWILARVR